MSEDTQPAPAAQEPGIKALLEQLADDTRSFARAEIGYLKAQAGERAGYALPGLVMIGVAIALAFGTIVALLVGLTFWLSIAVGPGWALLIVTGLAMIIAWLLVRFGAARLKASISPMDAP